MALRKRIFMVLAACLAVAVLAGCGEADRKETLPAGGTENPYEVLEGEPVMPTVTPEDSPQAERRPWYEDEVIELAKQQISWEYYAVAAEQDPETREWTVTFWSRDREDFQVVIIDQYGGILQVQEGTFWSATE